MGSRTTHRIFAALVTTALFVACEDVVNVEIKDAQPQLVIEGRIDNGFLEFYISRSIGFYSDADIRGVYGAEVIVTTGDGAADTLRESNWGAGLYVSDWYYGYPSGETYRATVTIEGKTFTATTSMPEWVRIDSLGTEFSEGIGSDEIVDGYKIHVFFQDAAERADYARFKLRRDGVRYTEYFLYDGKYTDGNAVDYEIPYYVFQPGDAVEIELISMDRVMFDYFQTLSEVWIGQDGGSILDGTPANPNTNWSGGALGYFGAFVSDYRVIRIVSK